MGASAGYPNQRGAPQCLQIGEAFDVGRPHWSQRTTLISPRRSLTTADHTMPPSATTNSSSRASRRTTPP